jgi:hypothetical protein
MKIFLCGAHQSGKTSILNDLNVNLDKFSGKTKKLNYEPNLGFNNPEFIEFQLKLLTLSLTQWIEHDNFICSNSIFNIMAHVKYGIDNLNTTEKRPMNDTEKSNLRGLTSIMTIIDEYIKILHKDTTNVLYFLIEKDNTVDNYDKYDRTIQHYVEFFLKRSGIDYVKLTGSIADKVGVIESYL